MPHAIPYTNTNASVITMQNLSPSVKKVENFKCVMPKSMAVSKAKTYSQTRIQWKLKLKWINDQKEEERNVHANNTTTKGKRNQMNWIARTMGTTNRRNQTIYELFSGAKIFAFVCELKRSCVTACTMFSKWNCMAATLRGKEKYRQ